MRLFIPFLTTVSVFLGFGCANSSIKMPERDQLIISNNKSTVEVTTPIVETTRINMSSVYVDQNILAVDEDHCIVYEDIRTAGGYRFNYAYKRSIDLIFNAYSVEEGKSYGNLTLYRVTLRDENRSVVNLLALTASKKSLKLVYGFDDEAVTAIENSLDQNSTMIKYTLSTTTERRDHCIKSNWQPKLLIMDNLVGTEGGRRRGGGF